MSVSLARAQMCWNHDPRACGRCTGSKRAGAGGAIEAYRFESEGGRSKYCSMHILQIGLHVGLFTFATWSWTSDTYGISPSGGPMLHVSYWELDACVMSILLTKGESKEVLRA